MNDLVGRYFFVFFPAVFAATWLMVTTLLGVLSGWFALMVKYPDQSDRPVLRIRRESGMMGLWVGMSGILKLDVCLSGLRVGMMRVFGPFSRNFFVPWAEIKVIRKTIVVWPVAELQFGTHPIGKLTISALLADRLARTAMEHWPEAGQFPKATRGAIFRGLLWQWAAVTCLAALFFTLVPLAVTPSGARPPVLVGVLFPAIFFAIVYILRYIHLIRQ